jgi:hypothetical protein
MSIVRFNSEVLSKGPSAVLPQNLSADWLETLQTMADKFLECNFDDAKCSRKEMTADPLLLACVSEIIGNRGKDIDEISDQELTQLIASYCVEITVETVGRHTGTAIHAPGLHEILTPNRMAYFKKVNPDLGRLLHQFRIA